MKAKNNKQKNPNKTKPKKNNKEKNKNIIEKNDLKENEENNNQKKINEELNEIPSQKPSPMIFLTSDNLQGFHFTFIMMIILPITTFFIVRNVLKKFNFTENQQNVYGVVGVLISVWLILVSYIVYYFRNDFYTVFCKKKEKMKEE